MTEMTDAFVWAGILGGLLIALATDIGREKARNWRRRRDDSRVEAERVSAPEHTKIDVVRKFSDF